MTEQELHDALTVFMNERDPRCKTERPTFLLLAIFESGLGSLLIEPELPETIEVVLDCTVPQQIALRIQSEMNDVLEKCGAEVTGMDYLAKLLGKEKLQSIINTSADIEEFWEKIRLEEGIDKETIVTLLRDPKS